jgi:putative ABC transport system substrate-binding protein
VLASRKATTVIPIVFSLPPDPVGTGLVKSLSRPGGNVTGVSTFGSGLVPKRIELIRELVPKAQRIGVLYDSREPSARSNRDSALRTARALGLTIIGAEAHSREGIPLAFALLKKERADALLVFEGSLALTNRELVLSLAAANALPALYTYPEIPTEGGLMSYTANTLEQYRRAASYVDKILKGAKPGDLPIEQPTTFELVINLKTAKALGIRIPPSILLRADRVLE